MTEQVFVVPDVYVTDKSDLDTVENSLDYGIFMDRDEAEVDESFKQIIPYVVIAKKSSGRVLAYKRSKQSGEGRLHNKWSVGFGGHVNPEDFNGNGDEKIDADSFLYSINRELTEELEWDGLLEDFDFGKGLFLAKAIYDSSNAVGRVHLGLGILMEVDVPDGCMYPKAADHEVAELRWVTYEEALELENLEGWSKMMINRLKGKA